jgi:hypothetical protein
VSGPLTTLAMDGEQLSRAALHQRAGGRIGRLVRDTRSSPYPKLLRVGISWQAGRLAWAFIAPENSGPSRKRKGCATHRSLARGGRLVRAVTTWAMSYETQSPDSMGTSVHSDLNVFKNRRPVS